MVSDGSGDRTVSIANQFQNRGVRVIDNPQRRGKSAAINDATDIAQGEIVVFTDANVFADQDSLAFLVANFEDPKTGAAFADVRLVQTGTGLIGESVYQSYEFKLQRIESLFNTGVTVDGGLFAMRQQLFQPLKDGTILDDFTISSQILGSGHRIVAEPRAIAREAATTTPMQEFRRRVRMATGYIQVLLQGTIPRNGGPKLAWQFISHKLLRWFAPFFWCLLLISNLLLVHVHRIYAASIVLFAVVTGIALMSLVVRRVRGWSLPSTLCYYLLGQVAVMYGVIRGLLYRQSGTWDHADRCVIS